ncbi:MAG: hypothetical protein K2Y27_35000 [Xanthobacteraceae bacterium]|nr:hypothetical protein [Xanthobacteraceae bacterium]
MPIKRKVILIVGIAATQILASNSYVLSADLHLRSARPHYRAARVVADYDGTAIYLRRARPMLAYDGTVRRDLYDAYPVLDIYNPRMGPEPTRYFTGQRYP